jgi:hypothetical protein
VRTIAKLTCVRLENIRGNPSGKQNFEEKFAFCFNDGFIPDQIKRLVSVPRASNPLGLTMLVVDQNLKGILSGAVADAGISAGEIRFGDLQV